jgi:uncharacterized membrane protein YphA (DoxX/SURF4 family)
MGNTRKSIGTLVLQIALGLLFIVGGIWTIQGARGDELAAAFYSIFDNDIAKVISIVFAIIEMVAGVFLILRLFLNINTKLDTLLLLIIMIVWIVAIILMDFLGSDGLLKNLDDGFLGWVNRFARHLLVFGAVLKVKDLS